MKNLKNRLFTCAVTLLCTSALAQTPKPQNTIKLFFEKVFIHTDRTVYTQGEDIWFKAYVINSQDNRLIAISKNLYVEIIDPENSIVDKEIIRLDKGMGKGDILLSDQLPSGNYRLRAYTNWMRNFGDNFIFEKTITITGKQTATINGSPIAKQKTKQTGKANTTSTNSPQNKPSLRFYPEGGSLVTELSAIVAVKAEDGLGNGIPVSGPILSATGDTVARFTCDSLGMGLFAILPQAGQKYHSSLNYKGQAINAALPDILNSGLSLKVSKRDTLIFITISCNNAASAALTGKSLIVTVKHAGTVYIDQQIQLNNNQAIIKIPASILPEGIAAITLYDDQRKPNCERVVYIDNPAHKTNLMVSTDKSSFNSREKVVVNIKATDANERPVSGNFSLSATDAGVDPLQSSDITTYVMLQSEVRGQIAHIERYFDTTNVNRVHQLDLLLLTQGWRDFVWKRLADTAIKISYLPEQGFTVSGTVKNESGKLNIPNSNITLSAPKANGQKLFFTKSDAKGNYYFDNLQLFGQQILTATTRDEKGKVNGFITLDSLNKNQLPVNKAPMKSIRNIPGQLTAELEKRVPANKRLDSVTNLKEVKINGGHNVILRDQTAVTAGYADEVFTVTPKDYSFNTLKDYILYVSKQAKLDPNSDQIVFYADGATYKPRIIVDNKEEIFQDDDEMQAHYYSAYYALSMNVVEKVVIKRLLGGLDAPKIGGNTTANILGNSTAGARSSKINFIFVIYLTLKPGAMFKNGGGIATANVQGYYENRTFYEPIYDGRSFISQKPDLRNTIHWEPEIKTDVNGQATVTFYNADPKTKVRIVVQGVTDTGEPVNAVNGYVVK